MKIHNILAKHYLNFPFYAKPQIAIFEPDSDLATNPTLLCLIHALSANGYNIDLLMPCSDRYPSLKNGVSIFPYNALLTSWRDKSYHSWEEVKQIFRRLMLETIFATGLIKVVIGINSRGLIKAYKYAKRYKVPLIYLNFEIFFYDELLKTEEIEEKKLECIASEYTDLIIIQDEHRAKLLAHENSVPLDKFVYLPVSPNGFSAESKTSYLRKRFNISEKYTIVLHSGSFENWTYAEELLANLKFWPKNFVLVIHTRYNPEEKDYYIRTVQDAQFNNVVLSTNPLSSDEYEQLVASADIGLALYKSVPPSKYTQKNIEYIGLSSGKFSYFMKFGIPVISVNQKCYADLLVNYAFGENIQSFANLPNSLERLWLNYNYHSLEARRLYKERLIFDVHWPSLFHKLSNLAK